MSPTPPANDTLPLFTNRMQNIIGEGEEFCNYHHEKLKGQAEIGQRSPQEQYMFKLTKDEPIYLIIYFNKTNNHVKVRSTGNKSFLNFFSYYLLFFRTNQTNPTQ